MTDEQLIELLEQKTPDELTIEEIDLLRRRLGESAALREKLLDQLQMETYLSAALARVNISPQQIVARAQRQTAGSRGSWTLILALLIGLPLAAIGGAAVWNVLGSKPQQESVAQVERGKRTTNPANRTNGPAEKLDGTGVVDPHAAVASNVLPQQAPEAQQKPVPGPTPAAAAAAAPWQAALNIQGELPSFTSVAFEPFDTTKAMPQQDELRQWFEAAPGSNFRVIDARTQAGVCAGLEGVARLRSPWPENAVLRLAMENYNRLKIHFFSGDRGVTLVYYEDQQYRWAAYTTTRETGKAIPKTWSLTATDDDRCRRTEIRFGGPLELRYHGGDIILSRGDIMLVSAPLPGPPTDVFFEGRAAFQGINLIRTQDAPPSPPRQAAQAIAHPAELDWKTAKPEIMKIEKLADGAMRFAADKAKERTVAYTSLPHQDLSEIVFQLEEITPGAGIGFSYIDGQVQHLLRFYLDRRTRQLCVQVRGWDDEWERDFEQVSDKAVPLIDGQCWIKLLYGCGNLRWWVSSDGIHWAEPEYALDGAAPVPTGLAVQVVANRPDVRVTVKQITTRELRGLTSLAPAEVRQRAFAQPTAPTIGIWLAEALTRQPADIGTSPWLRACALRTLAAGAPRDLAYPLLEALLDEAAASDLPLESEPAALNDAMLLAWDLRDGGAMQVSVPTRYLQLGRRQFDRGSPPWSSVRHAWMSVPIHTHVQTPLDFEPLIRWETVQRAYAANPIALREFTRQTRFFNQHRVAPLVDWAEAMAARDLPRSTPQSLFRIKDAWREPLIEELNKETYNALSEIQTVIEGEAWDDAARLVTTVDSLSTSGLAPYMHDPTLLVSLPIAVRLALADFPPLRDSLSQNHGPLARLRISQATAAGDAEAVEMATIQFAGTDSAADAHHWLGDRALASGWFEQAIAEYRRAIGITPSVAAELSPRIRLAAAMLGRDEGQPPTQPVRFNELTMNPTEYETLVAEMRARGTAGTLSEPPAVTAQPIVPGANTYDAQVRSRLDGPAGERPQEEVGRRTNQHRVPWVDRQIATAVEGDTLYVTNRFQVAAYNLTNGQRMWQSQPPPGTMQRAQDWALIAMKPLVTGTHIFVRQLYSPNPLLVCIEKATGKIVWVTEPADREYLISDPIIVQGQLGAISATSVEDQQGLLRWNTFDPDTGELLTSSDLVRLRSTWGSCACCEVLPLDDSVIAVLGGVTMSFDPRGQVRWVRKHITLPSDENPRWVLQLFQRPIALDGKLFITQPGVRTVDCLELATGKLLWSQVVPELVGTAALTNDRLIIRTETEVAALAPATGETLWRYESPEMHSFQLADNSSVLIAAREKKPETNDQWHTRLTWLDAATGNATATSLLPNLVDPDPRLGPLVPYKDRLFTFFGRGQHEPTRDFVELIPAGEPERPLPDFARGFPWTKRVPTKLTKAAWHVLPDWQLISGFEGDRTGLVPEAHGEMDVAGIRSTATWPVVLARNITLPPGGRPRLRLRFGNDPGQHWKLEVRHGEQLLRTEEVKDETHKDRWKTLEIELAPAAGKPGWLTIRAQSTNGDHVLYWQTAELLF